jgi:hypothetical protein
MCPMALDPTTRAHGSSETATCPVARLPSPGRGQLWDNPVPCGRSCGLWAIKVNKYPLPSVPNVKVVLRHFHWC